MDPSHPKRLSPAEALKTAVAVEGEVFERMYRWLEAHFPPSFLEEISPELLAVLARQLMSFDLQNRFVQIHLQRMDVVLCLDGPDVDLKVLKLYPSVAIRYYRTFISNAPPPGEQSGALRIALLYTRDEPKDMGPKLDPKRREELLELIQARNQDIHDGDLETLMHGLTPRFVRSLKNGRLARAIDLFFRAKTSDEAQVDLRRNEDWKIQKTPSLQLVLAWRNVPKAGFLFRLASMLLGHGLSIRKVVATYIDPYSTDNVLILSMGLHGCRGGAAWEEADLDDLTRELCLLKYFETNDRIADVFVKPKLLTGNEAHIVRSTASFAHQMLLLADPHLFSLENVTEGLCRHPELTVQLCKIFEARFHPSLNRLGAYQSLCEQLKKHLDTLDTGQAINDARRKAILQQALNFIQYTLKTNFYLPNKTGFSFRLDPQCLDELPFERVEKFPELPFGIFFLRGMHWMGFHIRFKDLARGGVRTVTPERWDTFEHERNNIFSECFNLSYTQHKKNKDIPEGGAKTVLLLTPFDAFAKEEALYAQEMEAEGVDPLIGEQKLKISRRDHKLAFLFSSQRAFIQSFMSLLNCDEKGALLAPSIVDYYQRPEYIYLGPDENMLNDMIVWIAEFAVRSKYKPGRSFMSSKPGAGINHKEYGVTSYGVNVYLHEALKFIGIDPDKQPFTVKISGGPDGDVAGNEIHILATRYPKTAKLLALTDVSGTIFDPLGLDWKEMETLFQAAKPIRHYPPEKLHPGGFLLDLQTKREENAYTQQTLLAKKTANGVSQEWLSGNETFHLYRNNVHQIQTDAFVPGGGRPRTLNETNLKSFLDPAGKPTARIIVEGANLYLTPGARRALEELGVVVLKDSSCNKGGVICSSFEVLAGLCLSEEEFRQEKNEYVKEVLEIIRIAALNEARLLLETQRKTGERFTDLSEKISERINLYKYQLLEALEEGTVKIEENEALLKCLVHYCPQLLQKKYRKRILELPEIHKKAITAVFLASHLVYTRGLEWAPSITDVLTSIAEDPRIVG